MVIAGGAHHVGHGTRMAGVEDVAQLVAELREGVGFIDKQNRLVLFNAAVQRRRTDVRRRQWPLHQLAQHGQKGGLAAAVDRRGNEQDGRQERRLNGVAVQNPQCRRHRAAGRQLQVALDRRDQLFEQLRAFHRVGRRLDRPDMHQATGQRLPDGFNDAIQHTGAHAQLLGRRLALDLVLIDRQGGQPLDFRAGFG